MEIIFPGGKLLTWQGDVVLRPSQRLTRAIPVQSVATRGLGHITQKFKVTCGFLWESRATSGYNDLTSSKHEWDNCLEYTSRRGFSWLVLRSLFHPDQGTHQRPLCLPNSLGITPKGTYTKHGPQFMDHHCGPGPWTPSWTRSMDYPCGPPLLLYSFKQKKL